MIEINRIYNEDCLEGMKQIPDKSIDLVLTDPPYGIDFQSQWKKNKDDWMPKIQGDKEPFVAFIPELKRIVSDKGAVMIFTRWDVQHHFIQLMTDAGMKPKNVLIWDKVVHGMGDLKRAFASRYESILFWSNSDFRFPDGRPTDIIRVQRVAPQNLIHPNEKPVELLETLITKTTVSGDSVLDAFMGSGSTAIACINTNRNYIGFELDKHYCEIANERIRKTLAEKVVGE